jgi:two-component system cell cycle sensor histidine kinase/response regulator CckA
MPEGEGNLATLAPIFALEATMAADTCLWQGNETILLVEDEALVRKAASEVLQSAGYRVVLAESATQALEVYRESSGPVDLLLADIVMPGISGHELAQQFFVLSPHIRIMLMSGYVDQFALRKLSPYRKLAKPFSTSTLLRRVREVLDGNPSDFGAPA